MKLIFLDIDGVLNDHQLQESGYCGFKPECVANFNLLLEQMPDLKIVISSAWRYIILGKQMTLKGFEYMMLVGGVNCKDRVIGHTVSDEDEQYRTRGGQIQFFLWDWSRQNTFLVAAGGDCQRIDSYIVLDDLPFDFVKLGLNFFQTRGELGLTYNDVSHILKKLR
jgi:hypothetical protein